VLVLLCHFSWPSHMWVMARAMEGATGLRRGEARFADYLDEIAAVLGHASRAAAARAYCTGLLLPGARKSVEPMAARIEPGRVQARHQSLHHGGTP
jgi:SRSO17 transposase